LEASLIESRTGHFDLPILIKNASEQEGDCIMDRPILNVPPTSMRQPQTPHSE